MPYRDRKCERCDALFVATPKDVRWKEFECRKCRDTPPEPTREGIIHKAGSWLMGDGRVSSRSTGNKIR